MTTSWELTGVPASPGSRALIANLARRAVRAHEPLTITAIGAGGSYKLYVETDQHLPSTTRALRLTQVQAQPCEYVEDFDGARRQLARNLVLLPLGGRHSNGQSTLLTPSTQTSVAAYPHYLKGSVSLLGGSSAVGKAATAVGSVLTGIGVSLFEPCVSGPFVRPLVSRDATAAGCTLDCVRRGGFIRITARGYRPADADTSYAGILYDLCVRTHPDLASDREQLAVMRRVKQGQSVMILSVEMSDCDVLESAFFADTTHDWAGGSSPIDAALTECDDAARQVVANYKYYATEEEATLLLAQVFAPAAAG